MAYLNCALARAGTNTVARRHAHTMPDPRPFPDAWEQLLDKRKEENKRQRENFAKTFGHCVICASDVSPPDMRECMECGFLMCNPCVMRTEKELSSGRQPFKCPGARCTPSEGKPTTFSKLPDHTLELLRASNLKGPCAHCGAPHDLFGRDKHEKTCTAQTTECPGCDWKGPVNALCSHVKAEHHRCTPADYRDCLPIPHEAHGPQKATFFVLPDNSVLIIFATWNEFPAYEFRVYALLAAEPSEQVCIHAMLTVSIESSDGCNPMHRVAEGRPTLLQSVNVPALKAQLKPNVDPLLVVPGSAAHFEGGNIHLNWTWRSGVSGLPPALGACTNARLDDVPTPEYESMDDAVRALLASPVAYVLQKYYNDGRTVRVWCMRKEAESPDEPPTWTSYLCFLAPVPLGNAWYLEPHGVHVVLPTPTLNIQTPADATKITEPDHAEYAMALDPVPPPPGSDGRGHDVFEKQNDTGQDECGVSFVTTHVPGYDTCSARMTVVQPQRAAKRRRVESD